MKKIIGLLAVTALFAYPSFSQTPTLQAVTDAGNVTTKDLFIGRRIVMRSTASDNVAEGPHVYLANNETGLTNYAHSLQLGAAGSLDFWSYDATGPGWVAPRIRLLKNGNVGIGSLSPSNKLDVTGNIGLTGFISMPSGKIYSDINNMAWFHDGGFIWANSTNTVTRMRLTAQNDFLLYGNVTIGTNTAQKQLAVNGNIKTRKIKVTTTDWADYVFDSSYQLSPLSQVEQYIQQYKHLPDVPSEMEVQTNGVDLGDTQVVLLKKIEELTLYIIEQNKQIKSQQQQLETQKQVNEVQKQNNTTLERRMSAIEKMLGERAD